MVRRILNIFTTVLLVFLVIVVVFVFVSRISGEVPKIFGYQIYRVSSSSMEPTLEIGDVILVKEEDPSLIKTGDIITYKGTVGDYEGKIITHRVYKGPYINGIGNYSLVTKGDSPGAIEDPEITSSQIYGVFVSKIPLLNHLYTFFLSEYGLIAIVGIIVILFAYELISIIFSYKSIEESTDEELLDALEKPKVRHKKKTNIENDDDMYKLQ